MQSDRDAIRRWLKENLQRKGRGARRALADFLGLRTEAVSRMTTDDGEIREISAEELLRMAEFFGTSPPQTEPEAAAEPDEHRCVPVMGFIGAGAEVEPDFEQVPPEGFFDVEVPVGVPDDAIGFQVRGTSQVPAYRDGDVVIVHSEQRRATESLIGDEAAIRTYDGKRYIKSIYAGSKRHLYTLTSPNAPPIIDVRIIWASEIVAKVPGRQARKVERQRGGADRARSTERTV